ncbi:hypothetical protein [Methanococcus aeolicus]
MAIIYLGHKIYKSIKAGIRKLKTKKVKIEDNSSNGAVEVRYAKTLPVEEVKEDSAIISVHTRDLNLENNNNNNNNIDETKEEKLKTEKSLLEADKEQFINYLVQQGLTLKDNILYYLDKSVYPIYKKSYPINNIIRLYDKTPKEDLIILGLKGAPNNPKILYSIPTAESKERMNIDELKNYIINI